nr:MAG TPA: hypothetical protein [Caudoviricetes sp.]DAJ46830.1 MAG TPA: hypothetical protein [Bacteriophage sp.]
MVGCGVIIAHQNRACKRRAKILSKWRYLPDGR